MEIRKAEDFKNIGNHNYFYGTEPEMLNSVINFRGGGGNILYCEENVRLRNTTITFSGTNSVVYLSKNSHYYFVNAALYNDSSLYIDENNYFNGVLTIVISEQSNVILGKESIFSYGITVRTADPHLVYDCKTYKRMNPTKSVHLGDHVWIGQSVLLLKGTVIDSGSIIGAGSVVAGKKIPNNTSWAGNPAKMISEDVFWDGACVHMWTEEERKRAQLYSGYAESRKVDKDSWIFSSEKEKVVDSSMIDEKLSFYYSAKERFEYLKILRSNKEKNRFVF